MNIPIISLIFSFFALSTTHAVEFKPSKKAPSITQSFTNNLVFAGHFIAQESWETSKIIALVMGASVLYGILHDQVTARICLEYFSRGFHQTNVTAWPSTGVLGTAKKILQTTESPTVTACIWGPIATFGIGLLSGGLLSFASRFGEKNKYTAQKLIIPVMTVMTVTGVCSALALGFPAYNTHKGGITQGVPIEKITPFWRCASSHNTAYTVGAIGITVATLWVFFQRLKNNDLPSEKKGNFTTSENFFIGLDENAYGKPALRLSYDF